MNTKRASLLLRYSTLRWRPGDSSSFPFLGFKPYFTRSACKKHITDELTGIKRIIESRDYNPDDIVYPLEDTKLMSRVKKYKG